MRRIRHLELVTSQAAVIGLADYDSGKIYFSLTGRLVVEILRALAAEDIPSEVNKKSFKLIDKTRGSWFIDEPMVKMEDVYLSVIVSSFIKLRRGVPRRGSMDRAIEQNKLYRVRQEMIALLYQIKEIRDLTIL